VAKVKKMKKWGSRARLYAEQAEAAADRAEAALRRIAELTAPGSPAGDAGGGDAATPRHSPAYTSPRGHDATPPAAEVP
jgi:hypothetical protein